MITFKQYLNEDVIKSWSVDGIDMTAAIDLLNVHCKSGLASVANGSVLFRGFNKVPPAAKHYSLFDSSDSHRTSKDSNNLYQLMMDNSSALASFPSRSKSFICSTSLNTALAFGGADTEHTLVMIPFDGTVLGVCASNDMFAKNVSNKFMQPETVEYIGKRIARFLNYFVGHTKYLKNNLKVTDTIELNKIMSTCTYKQLEFNLYNSDFKNSELLAELIMKYPKDKRFDAMSSILATPESFKIRLGLAGDKLPTNTEIWFSGKAIGINVVDFYQILKTMKNKGMPVSTPLLSQFKKELM